MATLPSKILTVNDKGEEKILRRKTQEFYFEKHSLKEIKNLIKQMRSLMKSAEGIGLSANQLGLNYRFFIAKDKNKFYTIFNPEIIKISEEKSFMDEGCLSVPGIWGPVERPEKITVAGLDIGGKKIKIKSWGILARIFQHETDHLNGILFIDKAKELFKLEESSTVKISEI